MKHAYADTRLYHKTLQGYTCKLLTKQLKGFLIQTLISTKLFLFCQSQLYLTKGEEFLEIKSTSADLYLLKDNSLK